MNKIIKLLQNIKNSRLVNDSITYTYFNLIQKTIPFIILPIVARILDKQEFGYYILFQAIIELLFPVMTINIDSAILINYYKLDEKEFRIYFTIALFLFGLLYGIILTTGLFFSGFFANLISFPTFWLRVIFIITLFKFITKVRQNIWRVKFKLKQYGIYTVCISLFQNLIGLLLIYLTDLSWRGLIIGHLVGYGVFGLLGVFTFYKDELLDFQINYIYIKDALRVGFPLCLHKFGLWLGGVANRVLITSILGAAATGSYGIAATFGMMVTLIENSFSKAFVPHLFSKLKDITEQRKLTTVKLTYFIYGFLLVISMLIFILGYYGIEFIFGNKYLNSRDFILPLILVAMFKGFYKLHVNYILFQKKTYAVPAITFTIGILNIIISWVLINRFEILGAAYALLFSTILMYIFSFYVGNKFIPMPWLYFRNNNKQSYN